MNSRLQRRSGIGWSALLVVIALALFGNHLGFFAGVDGRIFDSFHRLVPQAVDDSAVLLVECNPSILERDNPDLEILLSTISKASPKVIGVVSERAPLALSQAMVGQTECVIVEGRPAALIRSDESLPTGFSELSFLPQPVFRSAHQRVAGQHGQLFSFEQLLLAKAGFFSPITDRSIGVRFGQSIHSIPRISASRILDQNYLSDLVRDRIVIVGESMPQSAGMLTPASTTQRMPRLEVRGHVVLTLLNNRPVQQSSLTMALISMLLCWGCLCFIFRELDCRHFPFVAAVLAICALGTSYLVFRFLSICLPATGLLFLLAAVPICLSLGRFRVLSEVVSALKLRLNVQDTATANLDSDDPWKHISAAVDQFFGPHRTAFFELRNEDQYLKLVLTNGLREEEKIYEQRRDINRNPWRNCIYEGRAKENTSRPIFLPNPNPNQDKNPEVGDFACNRGVTEFIVPLVCKGKIFGLMVLEMSVEQALAWPDLDNVLNEVAVDFAELIDRYQRSQVSDRSWKNWTLTPELRESNQIAKRQKQIDESVNQMDLAFETDSCCRLLFDAFGRVIKVNSRMVRRLETDKPVFGLVFTDLVQMIADVDQTQAREIFRNAILSGQKTELENRSDSLHGNIVVSPVAWSDSSEHELLSSGILVEIFDARRSGGHSAIGQQVTAANSNTEESLLTEFGNLAGVARDAVAYQRDGNFETVWRAALFNAQPRLQAMNLSIAENFKGANQVVVRDGDVVANTVEVCLAVLAECSNRSDTLKAQLGWNATHWILDLRNGQEDQTLTWSSPSILGTRQAERLFAARKKMQANGGSVDVDDSSNGEVVIQVSFPAGAPQADKDQLKREARNV